MAETAKVAGLLLEDSFIVTVWALVLSTFIAPFLFDHYLRKKKKLDLQKIADERAAGVELPVKMEDSAHGHGH